MEPKFHEAALRVLGVEHQFDAPTLIALQTRAAQLGIRMPAAFVEWFGMPNGRELLHRYSNDDDPIEIESLGDPARVGFAVGDRSWPKLPLLPFMVENQGVCIWAVQLDGGDDPPVMVARDPDNEWQEHAPHFSTFIACQIDDHREVLDPDLMLLQAQDVPLRDDDLQRLGAWFRQGVTTHGWPGRHQYRFASDAARILIWDDPEVQADWFLASRSEDALLEPASTVWPCGELALSLWSNDERGKALLAQLRGG